MPYFYRMLNMTEEKKKSVWLKVLIGLTLLVVAGACAIAYQEWDKKRVLPATSLNVVDLGMRQEQVMATFGRQPDCPVNKTEENITMTYSTMGHDCGFVVTLNKDVDGIYRTARICEWDGYVSSLGSRHESSALDKLGKPDSESFSSDGTSKIYSFKKYNFALHFSGGLLKNVCVTRNLPVKFSSEFKPS
jgi:hypothetical protein